MAPLSNSGPNLVPIAWRTGNLGASEQGQGISSRVRDECINPHGSLMPLLSPLPLFNLSPEVCLDLAHAASHSPDPARGPSELHTPALDNHGQF